MIQALVNGVWKSFSEDELQPGTGSFKLNTGLYETFRTRRLQTYIIKTTPGQTFPICKKINLEIIYSRLEIGKMIKMVIHNFMMKTKGLE